MSDPATIERWKATRQEELDAEAIYRALASSEANPERARIFSGLADDEGRHAAHWEGRLREAGIDPGPARPGQRARVLSKLAGDFGDTVVAPIMREREKLSTEAYLDESGEFALDEEQKFKAEARRNRLLGHWAAGKLGMTGDAAAAYAKEVVAADFEEAGDSDVLRKVAGDFAKKGIAISEADIRAMMGELMAEAVAQVKAGK